MSHLDFLLSEPDRVRALEIINAWPSMDKVLQTIVSGAPALLERSQTGVQSLLGRAEAFVTRRTYSVAAGGSLTVTDTIPTGYFAVAYGRVQWDVSLSDPNLGLALFIDSRLITPSGYAATKATGEFWIKGYEAASQAISVVVTNGTAYDIVGSSETPVILMDDTFYHRTYVPLRDMALDAMASMAELARRTRQ